MKTSRWNIISYIAVLIITIGILIFTYWQYQPSTVITAQQPFKVLKVQDRTYVLLDLNYCKKVKVTGTVRVSFVSKTTEIFTPMSPEAHPTGCTDRITPILLPSDITPDTYYVKITATYRVNPIRTFAVTLRSDQFEVK